MDIPVADIIEINVNPAIIVSDNSNNLIYTETKPKLLINQTAVLERECIIMSLESELEDNLEPGKSAYFECYNNNKNILITIIIVLLIIFLLYL